MPLPSPCAQDDMFLAKWTFIRYLVLGSFMSYRFWKLSGQATELYTKEPSVQQRDAQDVFDGYHPFAQHPHMTTTLATAKWLPTRFFWAGCLFIQSEGVGLAVYFGISALMDNFTIFLVHEFRFCKYVTSVALYTMSLASFLPTAAFAYHFQHRWYEGSQWSPMRAKRWYKSKLVFIATMVLITVLFFIFRLKLIETIGWDATMDGFLDNVGTIKVAFAICVPPLIDLIQSLMLVTAADLQVHAPHSAREPLLADGGHAVA